MTNIQHGFVDTDWFRLHYVESGTGPAVIFCHGFPEFWFSWRHQLPALAKAGYRAIAVDMRGHGQSDTPPDADDYSVLHTVGDIIGLMDALEIDTAAIVGHDAGTTTAYHAALMRPDRIHAVAGLSVPYLPRGDKSILQAFQGKVPPGFYMQYFQDVGVAEKDLEVDHETTLRRLFFANSGACEQAPFLMTANEKGLIANLPDTDQSLPFLNSTEFAAYVETYRRTGFKGGLNGYRVFDRNWTLTTPWANAALTVPSLFIGGTRDTVLGFPGFKTAAHAMGESHLIDGAGHWIQMERPEEVNALLLAFLGKLTKTV